MKDVEFIKHAEDTFERCLTLLKKKGEEYSQDKLTDDRLAAFRLGGAIQNISPKEALLGMMAKHLASIVDMSKRNTQAEQIALWREKTGDTINYLVLLQALVEEEAQRSTINKLDRQMDNLKIICRK